MLRALALRDFVIVEPLDLELATGSRRSPARRAPASRSSSTPSASRSGARADAGRGPRRARERADIAAEFDVAGLDRGARAGSRRTTWRRTGALCLVRRTIDRAGRSRGFVNGRPATAAAAARAGRVPRGHPRPARAPVARAARLPARACSTPSAARRPQAREVAARCTGTWRRAAEARLARERAQEIVRARARVPARRDPRPGVARLHAGSLGRGDRRSTAASRTRRSSSPIAARRSRRPTRPSPARTGAPRGGGLAPGRGRGGRSRTRAGAARPRDRLGPRARRPRTSCAATCSASSRIPRASTRWTRRLRDVHDAARRMRVEPGRASRTRSRRAARGWRRSAATKASRRCANARRPPRPPSARRRGALSAKRRDAARRLGEEVTRRLQGLAMEGGRLEVCLEPLAEPSPHGLESVEFRVAAHAGQPLGPVGKVASGGELSRLALAIQVLMGGRAGDPDAGLRRGRCRDRRARGGDRGLAPRGARRGTTRSFASPTCRRWRRSRAHQLRVAKQARAGGTVATVEPLDAAGRVEEIARMLGGTRITETTRRHAEEMLGHATAARRGEEERRAGPPVAPASAARRRTEGKAWKSRRARPALVLAGGGARAAYQVGVLQAIKEMLPDPAANPFPIIAGTSAGAVNAGRARLPRRRFRPGRRQPARGLAPLRAAPRLPRGLRRAWPPTARAGSSGFFFGAFVRDRRISLLDNRPLAALLARKLEFAPHRGEHREGGARRASRSPARATPRGRA